MDGNLLKEVVLFFVCCLISLDNTDPVLSTSQGFEGKMKRYLFFDLFC